MKQDSLSILFFILKGRLLKNGEAPIILRVTLNGQEDQVRVLRSVPLQLWNRAKGRSTGKDASSKELNNYLNGLQIRLLSIHKELSEREVHIIPSLLLSKLFAKDEKHLLVASFKKHIAECTKLIGIDYEAVTINRYDNCARSLAIFIQREYEKEDVTFNELDGEFVRKFEIFLKTEKQLCQNTLVRYMKCFKKITNMALANKWMKDDPFLGTVFRQTETNPTFLTMEELETIAQKEFKIERLEIVRDLFLFCCWSGLSFIDAKELKAEHIVKDNSGNMWIRKGREKMRRRSGNSICNVPLLAPARKILEKYQNHPLCEMKGVCLPMYSNQKTNSYLKEIADFCGIEKHLTTHVARHSFGTSITLANNVSLQNVSKMMGHSSTRMTQHYARVLDSSIMKDMANVEKSLAKVW